MHMLLETWPEVLIRSAQDLWVGVVHYVPNIVIAIIVVLAGWAVGAALGHLVSQVIKSFKVDNVLRGTGVEDVLRRAGMSLDSGNFLGALVKWFVILAFLVAAFDVLGLEQVNSFLFSVLNYLPNVIAAVLILLAAAVIAQVMQNIVVATSKAAQMQASHLLGSVTRWAIWIFGIVAALDQLNIAQDFLNTIFTGIALAISLAVGLAFGLGGQQAAADAISKVRNEVGKTK